MLNKIYSWIAATLAIIFLTPILAHATSANSDFGVSMAKMLQRINGPSDGRSEA